ncbi:MAG: hypothetical protein V4649_14790 [Bacteroidota bacterium]
MSALGDICDVFATLHDGGIEECSGTYEELEIKVGCTYLAEYIDPAFDNFFIILGAVEDFHFEEYTYPVGEANRLIYDFNELRDAEIELLNSTIELDRVKVQCTTGVLFIKCASIRLFDQQKNPLPPSDLYKISDLYWSKFGRREPNQ